jgi:hypothetical protein
MLFYSRKFTSTSCLISVLQFPFCCCCCLLNFSLFNVESFLHMSKTCLLVFKLEALQNRYSIWAWVLTLGNQGSVLFGLVC